MIKIETLTREEQSELELKTQTLQNLVYTSLHKQYLSIFEDVKRVYGVEYKNELKLIIHNTACALRGNCTGFPLIRDKENFNNLTKDLLSKVNGTKVSYTKLWRLLEKMESDGEIEIYIGAIIDNEKVASKIVLKSCWLNRFENVNNTSAPSTKYLYEPVIVHKLDVKGNKTGTLKKNVQGINLYRKQVLKISKHLEGFDISCNIKDTNHKMNTRLHRSFTEDFSRCGRWWFASQNIKSELRQGIIINNESCTEWDYSSQHPRFCYTKEGILLPVDFKPYNIDTSPYLEVLNDNDPRSLCKHILMLLLNSGNAYSSVKSHCITPEDILDVTKSNKVMSEFQGFIIHDHKGLVDALKEHNMGISKYFGKENHSHHLQNLDSRITSYILDESVKDGVCVLPYHDSFVVPKSNSEWLKMRMFEGWEEVLGTRNNCIIDCKF